MLDHDRFGNRVDAGEQLAARLSEHRILAQCRTAGDRHDLP